MTFYFYDVETSGFNPRTDRIMQFGGQRTDMNLRPTGQPDNILIKLTVDVLPEPDAVLVHGITPQKTKAEGISGAEFAKYLTSQVFSKDTIAVGFNNIRFDDEFIRHLLWRNFHDAYEWQWKNNCSRWDLLDVARITRALRPEGIKWPFAPDGKATVALEYLASVNKLTHDSAHDALSDVKTLVAVAKMIQTKQPKLFGYLLNLRDKTKVEVLVNKGDPLVYVSGRYPSEYEKATVAVAIAPYPQGRGALMYDLRIDPSEFVKLNPSELAGKWSARGDDVPYFPVKLLSYNRCPAVAPMSVLDSDSAKRLQLDQVKVGENFKKLKTAKNFAKNLVTALEIVYPPRQPELVVDEQKVDGQLYDGFVSDSDKTKMSAVRAAGPDELADFDPGFADDRLRLLLPLYKARNFPHILSGEEQKWWEAFRTKRLLDSGEVSRGAAYFKRIEELRKQPRLGKEQKFLLEELNLYGQSILPLTQ